MCFKAKSMNYACVLEYEINSNRIILVEDFPLCLKYNDKIKLYTLCTQSNTTIYIYYITRTSFGHNGHRRSISQMA